MFPGVNGVFVAQDAATRQDDEEVGGRNTLRDRT